MRRLLEHNEWAGVTEYLHYDETEKRLAIQYVQDAEPTVKFVHDVATDTGGWSPTREWKLAASIPPVVQYEMIVKYGADPFKAGNEDLMRRALNDPDYRYLRVGGMI